VVRPLRLDGRTRLLDWRSALVESDLHATTKLVGLVLSVHMNRFGDGCFPGTAMLIKQTSLKKSTVLEHIGNLETSGWLRSEKRTEGGRGGPREYFVSFPDEVLAGVQVDVAAARDQLSGHADSSAVAAEPEPSTTADSSAGPEAATVHQPSTNCPPGRTSLTKQDVRTLGRNNGPVVTWLTPYLDAYRTACGEPDAGRIADAVKPAHDELGADPSLALWTRWCQSDKSGFGPRWYRANWRKALGRKASAPATTDKNERELGRMGE
jgi:hypothetical protein